MKKYIYYLICVYFSFQQTIAWSSENTLTANTLHLPAVAVGSDFYKVQLKLIDKIPPGKFQVTDLKQLSVDTNFPPTPLWNVRTTAIINDTVYFQTESLNEQFRLKGFSENTYPFFSYNLSTDQWDDLPPVPIADPLTQNVSEMTGDNNAIYAQIRHSGSDDILFHKYDIATQKWQQNVAAPTAAREVPIFPEFNYNAVHKKIVANNKFYAISYGLPTAIPQAKPTPTFLHVFDQSQEEWKGRATLPRIYTPYFYNPNYPIVIAAHNTLYAFNFNGFNFLLQKYIPASNTWTKITERKLLQNNLSFYDSLSSIVTIPKLKIDGSDISMENGEFLMQLKLIDDKNGLTFGLLGFDPLDDTTLTPRLPERHNTTASLVLNNEIYFFSPPEIYSVDSSSYEKLSSEPVKTYNPLTRIWSRKENISFTYPEYDASQFLHHENKLYQINQSLSMTLSITDLMTGKKSNTAENIADAGTNWQNFGTSSVILNDKLYLLGGATMSRHNSFLIAFNSRIAVYDIAEDSWNMESPSLPTPRWDLSSAVTQNKIYTFGGNLGSRFKDFNHALPFTASDSVEIYDPNINSWSTGAPMPTPRTNHVSVVAEKDIYIFGGEGLNNDSLQTVDIYDTINNSWRKASAMPFARRNFSANFINSKIYIFGGTAKIQQSASLPSRSFMIYDPTTDSWETEPPEIAYLIRFGFQHTKYNGETAGATGQGRPLKRLSVQLFNLSCGVRYQVHGSNGTGWSDWHVDGDFANVQPSSFIEAVKIELVNCPGWHVEYQAHIQNVSWTSWVTSGAVLGLPEQKLRLEALKIRLAQD